jgi:hypothetical protein
MLWLLALCIFFYRKFLIKKYINENKKLEELASTAKNYNMRKNINEHLVGGYIRVAKFGIWIIILMSVLVFFRIIFDSHFPVPVEGHPMEDIK